MNLMKLIYNNNYNIKLKAAMVKIIWNFNEIEKVVEDKGIVYKIDKIEEVKTHKENEILGIEKKDKDWVTFSHYRDIEDDNNIRQIAFKIEDCNFFEDSINDRLIFKINSECENGRISIPLQFDRISGFWFEPTYYKSKNKKRIINTEDNLSPTGISGAGCFSISVISKRSKRVLHRSPNINVLPSAISIENYKQMLDELLFFRDDLVRSKYSKVAINTTEEYILQELEEVLNNLYLYLNRINIDPKVNLVKKWGKRSNYHIKKMESKTIMEKMLRPYSNKFTASKYIRSLDIYENQVIKYALYTLKNKMNFYKEYYIKVNKNKINEYKQELDKACKVHNLNKENLYEYIESEKRKYHPQEEVLRFLQVMDNKYKNIDSYMKSDYINRWEKCILRTEKILNIDFIRKTKLLKNIKLKSSQIFANDKNYLMVWKNLIKLRNKNLICDSIGSNYIFVRDTQNIYEYWCLFKMISLLIRDQGWELENSSSILEQLNKYLNNKGTNEVEGFSAEMEHRIKISEDEDIFGIIKLRIMFNCKLNTITGNYKKPDFIFKFTLNDKIRYVYMDAKYRNYDQQSIGQWERDIKDIAIDKYIESFKKTKHSALASFIIHSDIKNKYTNYGGNNIKDISYDGKPNHRYGAVVLLPGESAEFLMLMRMILEYHLRLYWTCWNCGEFKNIEIKKDSTIAGYPKYYCTCGTCGDFWVRNHCSNRGKHKLIKHLNNYHTPKEKNPWHVNCPGGCPYR